MPPACSCRFPGAGKIFRTLIREIDCIGFYGRQKMRALLNGKWREADGHRMQRGHCESKGRATRDEFYRLTSFIEGFCINAVLLMQSDVTNAKKCKCKPIQNDSRKGLGNSISLRYKNEEFGTLGWFAECFSQHVRSSKSRRMISRTRERQAAGQLRSQSLASRAPPRKLEVCTHASG